ncbi:hypothetical protein GBAR_LOCUS3352 [Geodia barretti]|uniref:Uncharacterized protein n=1 Tax=Geodia barretti TaxID=519541 RepID=A0AA35W150_GEOBA|nr:hypothetical protein GBAR_LOCUS3352 [Geodia barretti]
MMNYAYSKSWSHPFMWRTECTSLLLYSFMKVWQLLCMTLSLVPTTTTKRTGKLDINKDVLEAKTLLINLEKDELKDLFMKLGLSDATLHNKYSASVSVYASDLLRAWILGKDGVLKSGGTTWENLRDALISLNHHGVAENV